MYWSDCLLGENLCRQVKEDFTSYPIEPIHPLASITGYRWIANARQTE